MHNKETRKNNKNTQQGVNEQHHKHTTKKQQKATKMHSKNINEIKTNKSTYINQKKQKNKNMQKDKCKVVGSNNLITNNKKVVE